MTALSSSIPVFRRCETEHARGTMSVLKNEPDVFDMVIEKEDLRLDDLTVVKVEPYVSMMETAKDKSGENVRVKMEGRTWEAFAVQDGVPCSSSIIDVNLKRRPSAGPELEDNSLCNGRGMEQIEVELESEGNFDVCDHTEMYNMKPQSVVSKSDIPATKKRRPLTMEKKLDIIKRSDKGETLSQIGRSLDLNRSTVGTIVKDKTRILQHIKGSAPMKSTIITKQRSGVIADMEKLLILWLEDQNQRRAPVSLVLIQEKAKGLYGDLKNKLGEGSSDVEPFMASRGWFNRFKMRANLHNIKVNGEAASVDAKAASEFPETLAAVIKEEGYSAHQVFNVDETGLYWKKMPHRTYIAKEEKCRPGFKPAKDRLTLLLGGNAAGDFKLKPLLVYHSENPRAFKCMSKASLPVIWKSNPKAWVTLALFEDWFWHHFVPEVKLYCAKNNLPFRLLLILDNAPGHPTFLDDFHPDIKVLYLPPNTTTLLQPMDQGVIASLKAYYLRRTFSQATKATEGEHAQTLEEFWKGYNIYNAVRNIGESWKEVKQTTMNGVWMKLCPEFVNDFQGFEETVDQVTENLVEMGRHLELEIVADDVNQLLTSHSEELSNEDLMQLEEQKVAEEVVETPPPKRFMTKQMAKAFRMIDSALALFEEQDVNCSRFASVSRTVNNGLSCYKQIYDEKKKASVQRSLVNVFQKS
uniref:tigger transposable element-derived protein 1-like isoform X2 n=1 Tax=Myxine glutinosa TaxID=7769 RepID=UPI00358E7BA4